MRIFATLVAVALALASTTLVLAGVPDLGSSRVTDLTGELSDGEVEEIEDALNQVEEDQGVDLFVLFAEDGGGLDPATFTDEVFRQEGLGGDDALLVVLVGEQVTQLQLSDTLDDEISTDEQDSAIDEANDRFAEGDFAAGVIAAGERLGEGLAGGGSGGGDSGGDGDGGGFGFGSVALILIVGAVLVLGGMWLFGLFQGQRSQKQAEEEKDRQTGELAKRANAALIDTDEALREAEQEIGFAEAQFSESEVQPFRDALTASRAELNEAFTVRQQLDDDKPEDPDTRRNMLQQIVAHCDKALSGINQQKERLRELRELEKNAPQILTKLPAELDTLRARIAETRRAFERLQGYNPSSWQAIRGNGSEAEKRVAAAAELIEQGTAAQSADDRQAMARAARQAQVAAREADVLLDAIDHMEKALAESRVQLPAEIEAAEKDVSSARSYLATYDGPDGGRYSQSLAEAQRLLVEAEREAGGASPDYLAAIKKARQANTTADQVLEVALAAAEAKKRVERAFASALRDAEVSYTKAEDFIGGRRRGIGNQARTRLAEARRHLDDAQRAGATEPGLKAAQLADRLADQAYADAEGDFNDYEGRGGGFSIGGFPIGILFGGGSYSGGGWGGTRWGSGRSSGGFGGGGRSIGRSFGGGGGGGRSRGGRW
ncbi:MAG: TPM domain-containing protein [Dehalococcoidia bacterium]